MANIGLDATCISVYGKGVSRYQYNLIKSLAKIDRKNYYYVFLNKKNVLPDLPKQANFCYVRIYIPKRIIWDQFQLPMVIRKYKLDIYHSLIDTLPLISRGIFVLTVVEIPDYRTDLAIRSRNNSLYARLSQECNKFIFRPSLKKAELIIASSNSTKADLIQKYNVDEKKIRVLYLAADEHFLPSTNEEELFKIRIKYNAEAGYILHISSSDSRDNTPAVIQAYQRALPELRIPKKLLICGNIDSRRIELEKLIAELNLKNNIIFTGYLPEEELVQIYQAADISVDLPLYEGFGLQVIEAMACGVPVITSNATSLPEVVGDAGILVSPNDINGLTSALVRVLTDSGLRQMMHQKSLGRVKFFSWDKTAQESLAVYNELLSQSNY